MRHPIRVLAAACVLTAATPALARWERVDEAIAAYVDQKADVKVNKDGTYETTIERTLEIRRDAARQHYGTISFNYNSASSKLVSLKAEAITGGKTFKVDKQHIEDKPESGEDLGFDKVNRVTIAFPKVEVGTKLHYVYTMRTHTVPVAGHWADTFAFGATLPTLPPMTLRVRSAAPLQSVVDDPDHFLDVKETKEGGAQVVTVTLLKDAYFNVVNEKESGWFKKAPYPMVHFSTTKEWPTLGKTLAPAYEKVLAKPLPPLFERMADEAKREHTTFVDRANAFTNALANSVRYMGDWRTVKGGHVPRALDLIAQTAFGDCKDLASVTAASLRKMGYKANVSWIYRGAEPPAALHPVPAANVFNHAIVRAEDETGKVYWVDPTNNNSRAHAIRPDIAGRPAMVLDGERTRLETTPALKPEDSTIQTASELDLDPEKEEAQAAYVVKFKGAAAESITGAQLSLSKAQIDEIIVRESTDGHEVLESSVGPYDLSSRTVQDVQFTIKARSKYSPRETTAGHAWEFSDVMTGLRKLDLTGRVSGYPLGVPGSAETATVLTATSLVGEAGKSCSFDSPWLGGERKIEPKAGAIAVSQRYWTKTYGIGPEELHGDEFKRLQKDLQRCFGSYAVVFKKSGVSGTVAH